MSTQSASDNSTMDDSPLPSASQDDMSSLFLPVAIVWCCLLIIGIALKYYDTKKAKKAIQDRQQASEVLRVVEECRQHELPIYQAVEYPIATVPSTPPPDYPSAPSPAQ
ncbi:hypothetical protein HDU91_004834, partial [Kappamyces sp. JEL0680]